MPVGWGNEPVGRGARGFRVDQPPPNQADDLHAIRERFCGPKTRPTINITLAANQAQRIDLTGTPINALILTTATGQINVYLGDYTAGSGAAAVTPHIVGTASIVPNTEVIPLPPGDDYIITVQEGAGSTATGTLIPIYQ